ncbi:hypothetical protein F4778DRAFT_762750 [Xylariomycetidae sp. FL2044]|nr:hypothetical protein F4778DRAFT_762750 [Xylariomycetidae sp. FL2044]
MEEYHDSQRNAISPARTGASSSWPDLPTMGKLQDTATQVGSSSLPDPVPGPNRRHTIIIPPRGPPSNRGRTMRDGASSSNNSGTSVLLSRPFFMSPWPRSARSNGSSPTRNQGNHAAQKGARKARTPSPPKRLGIVMNVEQEQGNGSGSDITNMEFTHEMRMMELRRKKEFPRRLLTAIIGGIFVIVPMIIMSFDPSRIKSLVTSAVAVVLFAVTLAWCTTSDDSSLFVATAGYAAFLGVFVAAGTDASQDSPDDVPGHAKIAIRS